MTKSIITQRRTDQNLLAWNNTIMLLAADTCEINKLTSFSSKSVMQCYTHSELSVIKYCIIPVQYLPDIRGIQSSANKMAFRDAMTQEALNFCDTSRSL